MDDILYSPWRMDYIESGKAEGCIFCLKENAEEDKERLVLYRTEYSFVIMNLYPYNNGHLMAVPKSHVSCLTQLSDAERDDLFALAQKAVNVLYEVYHPDGVNIGMNMGKAAGAGVDDHIHVHILPRWSGDVNFMTCVGGVRVIPEDFGIAYKRLKEQFDKLYG
jgi:ATP adenylyltransferase